MRIAILLILFNTLLIGQIRVLTVRNDVYQGSFVQLKHQPEISLTIESKGTIKNIDAEEIVEIVFQEDIQLRKNLSCIVLNDDSTIYGKILGGSEDSLLLDSPTLGNCKIALEKIKEIRLENTKEAKERSLDDDVLYFEGGDVMRCIIEKFENGFVVVQHEKLGTRKESLNNISHITFALLDEAPKPVDRFAMQILGIDNTQFIAKITDTRNDFITVSLPYLNTTYTIPIYKIRRISFTGGKFVFVSDLGEKDYQFKHIPFFPQGGEVAPKMDRNINGGYIRIDGKLYHKGIGVMSRTIVQINLNKKYSRFQSHIGIDDVVKKIYLESNRVLGGNVVFQVFVDGKEKYNSKIVNHSTSVQPVDIDVRGGSKLNLVVDYGEYAHVNDLANWGSARLVKD